MRRLVTRTLILLPTLLLLQACGAFRALRGIPTQHIVMIESNGRLIDPTGASWCHENSIQKDNDAWVMEHRSVQPPRSYNWHPCNGRLNGFKLRELDRVENGRIVQEADVYLDDLFDEMDRYYAQRGERKRNITLFIHGGLNNNNSTIYRARDTAQAMLDSGTYPVFLNWQSNLIGALWEHLMNVRQGDNKGYKHSYLFPYYLGAGLARGTARAPATWFYQASTTLDRYRHVRGGEIREYDEAYCRMRDVFLQSCEGNPKNCDQIAVSKGRETHTKQERARATVEWASTGLVPTRFWAQALGGGWTSPVAWLPPKLIASPILDGLGGPAWDSMLRHAALGFHSDGVINPPEELMNTQKYQEGNGGFARFFRALQRKIDDTSCERHPERHDCIDWQLTVIGHSMGAIVVNHMLSEFGDLHFDNIVYMASAASVRDYERAVFPYMSSKKHTKTRMFHLTLHDFADIRDQYFQNIPPGGSLLVWIDSFLSNPETFRDRTSGRYDNLFLFAEETPPQLKGRISIKTFGVGSNLSDLEPQHHGDFGLFDGRRRPRQFWDEEFWSIDRRDLSDSQTLCDRIRN